MDPPLREIAVPDLPDAEAIWGATGRDDRGRLWIGISAKRHGSSGRLLRFDPATGTWADAGRVLDALARAGLGRPGMGQVKLHSRVVQAADGWMYFTSMDEEGEREDGTALPRWGSHLWRIHPDTLEWQHRHASTDALIALGAAGHDVWTLGYWDHVLLHHDARSGTTRRVVAGSVGGHISRNLVVDARGRAFVPRLFAQGGDAELLELEATLQVRARTPLPGYALPGDPGANHGITGVATRADGFAWFTTHAGRLFEIAPGDGRSTVRALGDLHPAGGGYAASLFLLDDGRTLAGVVQRGRRFDWVERDPVTGAARCAVLDTSRWSGLLLYGSMVRDADGWCHLVGRADVPGGHRPVLLAVAPGR